MRGHKVRRIVGDAAAAAETYLGGRKGRSSPVRVSRALRGVVLGPALFGNCQVLRQILVTFDKGVPCACVAYPPRSTQADRPGASGDASRPRSPRRSLKLRLRGAQCRRRGRGSRTKRRAGQARPVADGEASGGGCTACRQVADVGRRPSYEPRRKQLCAQPCCTSGRRLALQYWRF